MKAGSKMSRYVSRQLASATSAIRAASSGRASRTVTGVRCLSLRGLIGHGLSRMARNASSSRTGTPSCSAFASLLPALSPATR